MGLDRASLSPRLLKKLVYAGSNATSFQQGSAFLGELADYACKPRQVLRACHRIGGERLQQRQQVVASFEELTLAQRDRPPCAPPDLIAIMADGGSIQIRPGEEEERAAETGAAAGDPPGGTAGEPASKERCWREEKVGILVRLAPTAHETDPCPDLPEVFRDPLVVLKLAREVGHADVPAARKFEGPKAEEGGPDVAEAAEAADDPEPVPADEGPSGKKAGRRPGAPQVLSRRVVATRQTVEAFGPLLAAMAWSMGFLAAPRGAFVGDGAAWLWGIQEKYFPRLVPVVDFIHVLSYVFAAALAGRVDLEEGWPIYQEWITWVWQGDVERLLAALRQRVQELPEGSAARTTVAGSLGFLAGQKGRLSYAAYRQQGLPIMSSLIESTVKQIGRRVKGSEKFWTEEGAEAVLQLRADYLSDDEPMTHFWKERAQGMTGQNPYRRKAS